MLNYDTSIGTGGIGGAFPAQIAKLRGPQGDGGLAGNLFGLNPYQRARLNSQQQAEIGSQFADTNRAARWGAANELDRQQTAADQQTRLAQLGAAQNLAANFFGNGQQLANQQRQFGLDNLNLFGGLMGNLFGGW